MVPCECEASYLNLPPHCHALSMFPFPSTLAYLLRHMFPYLPVFNRPGVAGAVIQLDGVALLIADLPALKLHR